MGGFYKSGVFYTFYTFYTFLKIPERKNRINLENFLRIEIDESEFGGGADLGFGIFFSFRIETR